MCYGSLVVRTTEEVVSGQTYRVSHVGDAGHKAAALHTADAYFRAKDGALSCAACTKETMRISLTGIPVATQETYGLGPNVEGIFSPGNNEGRQDMVHVEGFAPIPFYAFAGETTRATLRPLYTRTSQRREAPKAEELETV